MSTTLPEILTQAKLQLERRRRSAEMAEEHRQSFRKFVAASWNIVDPAKPYIPNCWHVEAIADHLQAVGDGIQNLIVVVPPGSAKSTLTSIMYAAWKWTRNPEWRSAFASYSADLSADFSMKCRALIQSIWYQETFRPTWNLSDVQNTKTHFVNTAKGFRIATSVGGTGTGLRSECLGIDDALKTDDRYSPAALDTCIKWYETVWHNRLIDMSVGSRIVIGQRVADNDLIGHLQRRGGWELLHIPMEYNPARSKVTVIGWEDPRKKEGDLMFPPLFPRAVIEELKKNAEVWATQYQGEPNIEGGGILKAYKFNYWQPIGLNLPPVRVRMPNGTVEDRSPVDLPDSFDLMLQSWDLTFSGDQHADFVCGQVHAARGAKRFVIDQTMKRMGIVDTMVAIREMTGRYPKAHLKIIEKAANARAAVEMLERDVPGLVLVPPQGNKEACAGAVSPELEAGNWYLPHPMIAPWVGDPENPTKGGFLASVSAFPFAAHDDDVDAWSHGGMRFQKEKVGGVFGVSESDIRVDLFEIGEKWPRLYGMAATWYEVAAVWICRRPETDQHYAYAEYCAAPTNLAHHAAELVKPGLWIPGVITAADSGRDEKDGYAMVGKYRKMNLALDTVPANEESMILDLQEALTTGKLKVFSNLPRVFDEYRMFRRDDKGKLPERNDCLIKALYVAWAGRNKAKAPAEPPKPERGALYRSQAPQNGWMRS